MPGLRKRIQVLIEQRKSSLQRELRKEFGRLHKQNMGDFRRKFRQKWNTEKYRIRYKNDPEFRAKESARGKASRLRNPERESQRSKRKYYANKAYNNARKSEWAKRSREHVTRYRRDYYAKNRGRLLTVIASGRDRRDPSRVIRRTALALREGRIGLRDAIEVIRKQVDVVNGRIGKRIRPE